MGAAPDKQEPKSDEARRAERDAAIREGRFSDALQAATMGTWERVHRVLREMDLGVTDHGETDSPSVKANALGRELDRLLKEEGDGAPLGLKAARNACFAIACAWAALEGRTKKEYASDIVGALMFWGVQLGEADTVLSLWETGFLNDAMAAMLKLNRMGAYRRGHIPAWEAAFLPLARKYCAGKANVTLGRLILQARQAQADGRVTGIPVSDEGIRNGLKRMVARGDLVIPGYSAPAQQG